MTNQDISTDMPSLPEVIIDGHKVAGGSREAVSEIYELINMANIAKIRRYFDDRTPLGHAAGYNVAATGQLQELPFDHKAQAVSIINTGPAVVDVWVNNTSNPPRRLRVGVPLNINFETHVVKSLLFRCPPGLTAAIEVVAKY